MRGNNTRRQRLHVRGNASKRVADAEPEKLGSVLHRIVQSPRLRDTFRNREIYRRWGELVDKSVAESTAVVGFKRRALVVACRTQALAAELAAFRKEELLGALREGLGEGVVEDIRFVVEGDIGNDKGR